MDITQQTIVLASIDPPSVWDFYGSVADAEQKQQEANDYSEKLEKHGAVRHVYQAMPYATYLEAERAYYLSSPRTEITQEQFIEMLECLPPKHWTRPCGTFESFLMAEHWSGPYTSQYTRQGDRYWTKMVDATDRSTWMTRETITKLASRARASPVLQRLRKATV